MKPEEKILDNTHLDFILRCFINILRSPKNVIPNEFIMQIKQIYYLYGNE